MTIVQQRFEAMEAGFRRLRQPRYPGLSFTIDGLPAKDWGNDCNLEIYVAYKGGTSGFVKLYFTIEGRRLVCEEIMDHSLDSYFRGPVLAEAYLLMAKFYKTFGKY